MIATSLDNPPAQHRALPEPVALAAAMAGDRRAVESLLRWLQPQIIKYCRSRIGSRAGPFISADDVAQDVCIAVLTALPGYRDQGRPFLAFVYGIAAHKIADAYRAAGRDRAQPVAELPDVVQTGDDPETHVMQDEAARQMGKLLAMLPDKQRELLRLRVVMGLSAEDTAQVIGSTPGAVRVGQHRILARLRSLLAVDTDSQKADVHRRRKARKLRSADANGNGCGEYCPPSGRILQN